MLEATKTVEKRKMRPQYLDQMPLERERGITIKMQPVRMEYKLKVENEKLKIGETFNFELFTLNLIDTPGHVDFSYEVSRALQAVEGAVLLVDATQGIQAQTIANVERARALGLAIVPVINKIDLPHARISETREEIRDFLGCEREEILEASARTGQGVEKLLERIIAVVPPPISSYLRGIGSSPLSAGIGENDKQLSFSLPREGEVEPRALIFDFDYSPHRGVIAHVRVFDGEIRKGERLRFSAAEESFTAAEVGVFTPELLPCEMLRSGEIGYVATNIKEAKIVRVGDTILKEHSGLSSLPGYEEARPVVFSDVYPERQEHYDDLRRALERLKLADSSLSFESIASGILGRGFRCGFLGMLHVEIVLERLRRDFGVGTIVASPTLKYRVKTKKGGFEIYSPEKFPEPGELLEVWEPWLRVKILLPSEKLSSVIKLLKECHAVIGETKKFSESRIELEAEMPLRELLRDFFDELKSVSQGYASLNYEFLEMRKGDLLRLDILVAGELVPAFSKIVSRRRLSEEAERLVEKLHRILPQALFAVKIQAKAAGRILASRTLKALRKDVTGYLYGGDRSRKMKLWQKQREGKKRLQAQGRISIPPEVFIQMIKR